MKLSLLFVAILGVAAVSAVPTGKGLPRSTRSLEEDLNDFLALLKLDELFQVVVQYLVEDEECQNMVEYVQSDDFKALILEVDDIPEYIRFLNYLYNEGLDVYKWVNKLHAWLGLSELPLPARALSASRLASTRITGGVAGLIADLVAILPREELRALHEHKLQTSPEYAHVASLLTSEEAKIVIDALKANENYQHIRKTLAAKGVDVDSIIGLLKELVGWA